VGNALVIRAFRGQVVTKSATVRVSARKMIMELRPACALSQEKAGTDVSATRWVALVLVERAALERVLATLQHRSAVVSLVGLALAATNLSVWTSATTAANAWARRILLFARTARRVGWVSIVQLAVRMVSRHQWTVALVNVILASAVHLVTGNVPSMAHAPKMGAVASVKLAGGAQCATFKVVQVLKQTRAS
jgi:hypothetical protein